MKKQYTITTGNYDGFHIVARIKGEASPALSTLKKEFDEQFGFPPPPREPLTGAAISAFIWGKQNAENRARKSGLEGEDRAELFIDWLVRYHSYVVLKDNEVWIG